MPWHVGAWVSAWVSAWTRYDETPQFMHVAPACMPGTAKTGTALQPGRPHHSNPPYKIFLTINESLGIEYRPVVRGRSWLRICALRTLQTRKTGARRATPTELGQSGHRA